MDDSHTHEAAPTGSEAVDLRGGLLSRSFLGLLATQFLGAMNDNMFRWLVVPIGKDLAGEQYQNLALSAGLALLVLPFILLAAPAGYLADRFRKSRVIVGCKVAEVAIMLLGVGAILSGNIYVMFAVLFLMGSQSALFGPSKYGSIPEIIRPERISAANGLIGMTTILAIVAGTVAGGYLYAWTTPAAGSELAAGYLPGQVHWWLSAAALLGVAGVGYLTSLLIRPLEVADPTRRFPWNFAGGTMHDLGILFSRRPLMLAAVGSALFWSLAGLCQINVDRFATVDLDMLQKHVGPLLAVLALGVGVGNVLAGVLSNGRIELGIVPLGAAIIAFGGMLLSGVPAALGDPLSSGYVLACVWLFVMGFGAGMYDVPLQAFLQYRSPEQSRGAILAASNFLTFSGTLVAAGVFYLLSSELGFSGRTIFLLSGAAVVPLVAAIVWLLPLQTVRFVVWVATRIVYRVRLTGLENLPEKGGALLIPNHVSWADGVLLGLACPRDLRMVAYADYFENRWLRWFAKAAKVITIRPGRKSVVQSIRTAREALLQGDVVCIFPEGGITRTGQMQPFHPGFLAILRGTDVPVVPVYLEGLWGSIFSFEGGRFFWKMPRRLPYPVSIRFGPPIHQPADAEQVREAVASLGNDDARS